MRETPPGSSDGAAGPLEPGLGVGVELQQAGTGVAVSGTTKFGSRQPVNVWAVAPLSTGSLVSGFRTVYVTLLGARMNSIRSVIWM